MTNSFKTNLHQRRARSRWPLSPRHWRPAPSYRGPRRGGRRPLGGRGGKKQLRRTPMRRRRHHRRCCCCRSQHWRQRPSLLSAALFVAADAGTHRERCQRHCCEEQERQQRGEEPADGATKPAASFSFFVSIRSERERVSFGREALRREAFRREAFGREACEESRRWRLRPRCCFFRRRRACFRFFLVSVSRARENFLASLTRVASRKS